MDEENLEIDLFGSDSGPSHSQAEAPELQDSLGLDAECTEFILELPDIDEPAQSTVEEQSTPRVRKEKRPFSPDVSSTFTRSSNKNSKKGTLKTPDPEPPFCCDRCGSTNIINPSRLRYSKKYKRPVPRRRVDPETKKLLTLCNACGLAMDRPHRSRHKKQEPPTSAEKEQYLIEATAFAASVVEDLGDPEAEKLYCPVFKIKACRCVQRYITGGDGDYPSESSRLRANELLNMVRVARDLKSRISTEASEKGDKRVLRMVRAEGFEKFILENRVRVRQVLGLCERSCQRLLQYSNNFLHKDLKTGPEKGPRIRRMVGGKGSNNQLISISELANENCCQEMCVRLALSHSRLLESWREGCKCGQRRTRRVLAEMLTPSGGAQPNCYKFISLVTGCSFATISKVREHMRRTLGDRDPPEHGMKRWWQEHPKPKKDKVSLEDPPTTAPEPQPVVQEPRGDACNGMIQWDLSNFNAVQHQELQLIGQMPDGGQEPRPQLVQLQMEQPSFNHFIQNKEKLWLPLGVDCFSQTLALTPSQVVSVPANVESPPLSQTLTVLGPAAPSSSSGFRTTHLQMLDSHQPVIFSVPEVFQAQALSLLTTNGGIETLNPNPFNNVVILPESAILMPGTSDSLDLSIHNHHNMQL